MLKILQGDDTAANNRTITLRLPLADIGDGFKIGFSFLGIDKSGSYTPGGSLKFDYARSETEHFPLGIHYASVWLCKDGFRQTFASNIQIKVTDSVEEVEMSMKTNGNEITVGITVNTGVPHVDKDELGKSSSIGEIKELTNALLRAINNGSDPNLK